MAGEAQATNSLSKFINQVCSKLGVETFGAKADLPDIERILNSGQDRALLRAFREETTLIVLHVRLLNDERRVELDEAYRQWQIDNDLVDEDGRLIP